jgi:hypothetical protein
MQLYHSPGYKSFINYLMIIYNGVSMMFLQDFSTPDCILSCDSTLVGCGGLCGDLYFHKIFPRFIQKKQLHINVLELLCLVVSLKLWAHRLRGLKGFKNSSLIVECKSHLDNKSANLFSTVV